MQVNDFWVLRRFGFRDGIPVAKSEDEQGMYGGRVMIVWSVSVSVLVLVLVQRSCSYSRDSNICLCVTCCRTKGRNAILKIGSEEKTSHYWIYLQMNRNQMVGE